MTVAAFASSPLARWRSGPFPGTAPRWPGPPFADGRLGARARARRAEGVSPALGRWCAFTAQAQGCAVAQPRAPAGALARHVRKPGATRRSRRGRPRVGRRLLHEDHGAGRCLACQTVSMARTFWIDLFTIETWKEFLDHGSDVSGFSEKRRATVQRMKPGDYLLCYLTRVSRWVGVVEVTGEPFFDEAPIWSSQVSLAALVSGSVSRCVQSTVFRCLICAGN